MYLQHSVHTSTNQYIPVCTGMYWYVLVCTGIYWFVLVCTGTYQHVLHIFSTISCWNILIQTGTCQDVHSPTLSYRLVSSCPLLDTRRYKAVQGRTRKSRTPGYRGTRRYKALYLHVPPYPGVRDFLVLPCTSLYQISLHCTALYRLVSRRGQEDTRRYDSVPEWTSWHVPVCIRIFQQEEIGIVHAGMY